MSSSHQRSLTTPAGELVEARLSSVLGYQIAQASVTTSRIFDAVVGAGWGLHRLEFTILILLLENPGCTASSLAKALNVSAPNMTLWLERLIGKGLIERANSQVDRRVSHLHLTPDGARLALETTDAILANEAARIGNLSAAERVMLVELLHKVAMSRPDLP